MLVDEVVGPVVTAAVPLALVAAGVVLLARDGDEDDDRRENCPDCGASSAAGASECSYRGKSL